MRPMKSATPNPHGREGKPISLYPHTFDEIVDKMLATPPPPKQKSRNVRLGRKPRAAQLKGDSLNERPRELLQLL